MSCKSLQIRRPAAANPNWKTNLSPGGLLLLKNGTSHLAPA